RIRLFASRRVARLPRTPSLGSEPLGWPHGRVHTDCPFMRGTGPAARPAWQLPEGVLRSYSPEDWRRPGSVSGRIHHPAPPAQGRAGGRPQRDNRARPPLQAGGLMMEPHPGVFLSNVRTEEWEPDPEVPGSEMHELVHTDSVWAGLTRFTSVDGPTLWTP